MLPLTNLTKRSIYMLWLVLIAAFAALHAVNLRADFPNHSPWIFDWAKFTDEGWWANAAVRAHLTGNWYLPGDFNPAPAVPVWPAIEWLIFCFTGVSIEAARGLAVAFFFANLVLSYLLLRARGPRWMALAALTLLVTSPFLYGFSRLAILEPLLTALTLGSLNIAVRLPSLRRPLLASAAIGLLFALMMLTKTTAVFLAPALAWGMLLPFWEQRLIPATRTLALRCALAAAGAAAAAFGFWMALIAAQGLLPDYQYLLFVNKYPKPPEFYWPLVSLWWSFHGGLWVDPILIPLAGLVFLAALFLAARRSAWARSLLLDPVFGAAVLASAGYILFMTVQNHPQPRYFAVVAFFSFFVLAQGAAAFLNQPAPMRYVGWAVGGVAALALGINCAWTLEYVAHPEYTFVDAAQRLTAYIDSHPNGNRLLLSISGDQIRLVTHLPAICDDMGTQELVPKLAQYRPGWFATWNDIDPGTLEDLHHLYSLEQVAAFRAFDHPDRNLLVLFKLHPLPRATADDSDPRQLQLPLPADKIDIPIQ